MSALHHAGLDVVAALARLQLAVNRLGCRLWLRGADGDLRALLDFTGLAETLPHLDKPAVPESDAR